MASSSAYSRSSAATLSLVLAMLPLSLRRVSLRRGDRGREVLGADGRGRRGRAEPDRQGEQDQQQGRAGEDVGVAPHQLEPVPVVFDVPRQVAVLAELDRDGV